MKAADTPFPCPACPSSFPSELLTYSHVKRHHISLLPSPKLECGLCSKRFRDTHDLMRHIQGHCKGDKVCRRENRECRLCGKVLETETQYSAHQYVVHDWMEQAGKRQKLYPE